MMETETRVGLRGSRDTSVEGRTGGGRRVWVTARRRAAVGRAGCLAMGTAANEGHGVQGLQDAAAAGCSSRRGSA
eukprot:scaffold10068_cov56-Phaeocystis_antarctica.AAC.6